MARGKGKRGGRGGGKRFAAQSAEEIEERNRRLAAFDEQRAKHRAEAAEENGVGGGGGNDDDDDDDANAEREAMLVGMRVARMNMDDDEDGYVKKERKPKGIEGIIETQNPNKIRGSGMMKLKDLGGGVPPEQMTRKQREEAEKAAKAAAYRKRHEMGLTEEYKRDMAKLAEVKKRREEAAAKKQAEDEMETAMEEDRKKKAHEAGAADDGKSEKKSSKKKKSKDNDIPKLDKIAIKKMKPTQLKEALKVRGLDIQGNAKKLTERLLEYEKGR